MDGRDLDQRLADVAVLGEPARRALYLHVARQTEAVDRDSAARAVGMSRAVAAFHLDKLVEAGLLTPTYRRLSGKTGPGAGRPSKLYQLADRQIEVSLPQRRYEIAAQLLAKAFETSAAGEMMSSLDEAARAFGSTLGAEARRRAGHRPSRERLLASAEGVLGEFGFRPARGLDGVLRLLNCPFDALVQTQRNLTCGMNLSLMTGVLNGLRSAGLAVELDPQPGMCCVVWRDA